MAGKKLGLDIIYGVLFVALFACAAMFIAETNAMKYLSFSPLIVGILLGMFYRNIFGARMSQKFLPGIAFSSKTILRTAIILYGFRLTIHNIIGVGPMAVMTDIIVICGTLGLGLLTGKLLKLDKELVLLTSTGSAVCGAAAILGVEPILNNKPYKTAIAVSTVVIFGTIAMFVYPLMFRSGFFQLTQEEWGIYTGATVHEVAHVVGAGNAMLPQISDIAIVTKMIRVIFLAPVLLIFALFLAKSAKKDSSSHSSSMKITIPWFAFGFILVIGFNSLNLFPQSVVSGINFTDTFLLTMAMTALGLNTDFRKFKEAGFKPFILALILFIWLVFGGYLIVKYLPYLFSIV
ncbi:MAG: YeiH family protein [Dysgonomonas sp.]